MISRVLSAVLIMVMGALSIAIAWNYYAYQAEFSRAVAEMHSAIDLSPAAEKNREETEKRRKRAEAIFERLLDSRFFANQVILRYNLALLAYRNEDYDAGMAYLREALTRTTDPAVRAEILFALSFGAGNRNVNSGIDKFSNPKQEQLRLLEQALIEEPDHSSPRAKRAKRWWELLMRPLKGEQGKGGKQKGGKQQPEPQKSQKSLPGYEPEEPKP